MVFYFTASIFLSVICVWYRLCRGTDVDTKSTLRNELLDATYKADVGIVEHLLSLDPTLLSAKPPVIVDRTDATYGRTALLACGLMVSPPNTKNTDKACTKIAKILTKAGANEHAVDNHGWNAIDLAASKGYAQLIKFLLSRGVAHDKPDNDGITALMKCAMHGFSDAFQVLVASGASIISQSNEGLTALHYAVNLALLQDLYIPNFISTMAFLSPSVIEQAVDKDNRTILMYAAINNNPIIVDWLLQHGLNASLTDKYGVRASDMSRDSKVLKLFEISSSIADIDKAHQVWLEQTQSPTPEVANELHHRWLQESVGSSDNEAYQLWLLQVANRP
jgi:ankyrin repeat protein